MAIQVQFRRGTTTQHNTFTGASGEITVDIDKNSAVVHDGLSAGGFPLAKFSDTRSASNISNAWANSVATAGNNYTNYIGASSNAYALNTATLVGTAGNNYTIEVAVASNNWSNTKLSNTSGATFGGDLNISGNLSVESTTFFVNTITNKVGIGTSNPVYDLDIVGTINASALFVNGSVAGPKLVNETSSSSTYYPVIATATSGNLTDANTSSTKLYFVPSTGSLSATTFNTLSDRELKDNITSFDGKQILESIDPVSFSWKDSGVKSYGVIAQELEKHLPELVETNEQGLKSVSYIPLIAILIDVIQKQEKEIKEIKLRLNME